MSYTPGPPGDDDFVVLSQEQLEELLGAIDGAKGEDRQQLKTLAGWRWPLLRLYLAVEGAVAWPCRRIRQWFDWWIWPHQRGPK